MSNVEHHRKMTKLMNDKQYPSSQDLRQCDKDWLIDRLINQMNVSKALRELKGAKEQQIKVLEEYPIHHKKYCDLVDGMLSMSASERHSVKCTCGLDKLLNKH